MATRPTKPRGANGSRENGPSDGGPSIDDLVSGADSVLGPPRGARREGRRKAGLRGNGNGGGNGSRAGGNGNGNGSGPDYSRYRALQGERLDADARPGLISRANPMRLLRRNGNGNGNGSNGALALRPGADIPTHPGYGGGGGNGDGGPPTVLPMPEKPPKPKLKKLRVLFILAGLSVLAMASTVFGMMMAASQDLPAIENYAQFKAAKNSVIFDSQGERIGTLSSNENRILLPPEEISPNIKNATVAIEDARFYEHRGVDFQGIGRALFQDILSRSFKEGASTITQQLVKQALEAQSDRTVFQKLREISLAYHIEQQWTKDKILTEYLNTVYFGSGAYGVEAAARTYFAKAHPGCGTETEPCASVLSPSEAALLAGVIQNPYGYDPKLNPEASLYRRNAVLLKMYEQGYLTGEQYRDARQDALPAASDIAPPGLDSEAPFFTSWIRQQLVDRYGAGRTFFGGLKVKTTLDLELQAAVEDSISSYLGGIAPTSSVVVINNEDATIKAMVGGSDYEKSQFNLATQGLRQPGSTIKPFILTTALSQGISPYAVYESAPQLFHFGKRGQEVFEVKNYGDSYLGSADLATATTYSDNSIYAQVGLESIKGGPRAIAGMIHKMGVQDHIETNPAMVLGTSPVTPLEWTYAFTTLANDGERVSGTLASEPGDTPVAYTRVTDDNGNIIKGGENEVIETEVVDPEVAQTAKNILQSVVTSGTGENAYIGDESQWGKTGTTENNGDAWFCGAITEVTACVWVGHADTNTPMEYEYNGGPVDGGTFPALIWASVISAYKDIQAERVAEVEARRAAKAEDEGYEESGEAETDYSTEETYTAPDTTYTEPDTTYTEPTAPAPTDTAPAPTAPEPTAPAPTAPAPAAPAPTAPAPTGGAVAPSSGGASP